MRLAVVAALACSVIGLSFAQESQAIARKYTDIPAQGLGPALQFLAKDRNFQVVYVSEEVNGVQTAGAVGEFTLDEALTNLLAGTGLTFKVLDERTMMVGLDVNDDSQLLPTAGANASPRRGKEGALREGEGKGTSGPLGLSPAQEEELKIPEGERKTKSPDSPNRDSEKSLEEIVVTGTHIRGTAPVGAPLDSYDEEEIRRTGYSTVGEVLRNLPQSYAGGVSPGVVGAAGDQNSQNNSAASSANLRGLGSDSTLTLVNGRRLAPSGFSNAVDVSIIPIAAVERIEVLSDGASATYGADAVAGVVNFILKDVYDGSETLARFGGATRGGASEWQFSQLLGNSWERGSVLVSYEHLDQEGLFADERDLSPLTEDPTSLMPSQVSDSVFLSGRLDAAQNARLHFQGIATDRQAKYFETQEELASSLAADVQQFGLNAGADLNLGDWHVTVNGGVSRDDENYDIKFVFDGAVIDQSNSFFTNELTQIDVNADGHLFSTWAGLSRGAFGAGYRDEKATSPTIPGNEAERDVTYAFGELFVPIFGNSKSGQETTISLATRHEEYSDFGSEWTNRFGVEHQTSPGWSFRGSWATSFKAPSFRQSYGPRQIFIFPGSFFGLTDDDQVMIQQGSNSDLKPETATSWTIGLDYEPVLVPQLDIHLTYFRIDYEDRIAQPVSNLGLALSDPIYASLVTSDPSTNLQSQLVLEATTFGDFSVSGYDPAAVVALVENQSQNVAAQQADGVDISFGYTVDLDESAVDFVLAGSWLTLENQVTPDDELRRISGFIFNPPNFRIRGGATWQDNQWSISLTGNYVDQFKDNRQVPAADIDSWFTVDSAVAYLIGSDRDSRIQLSVQNLFDADPPSVAALSTVIPGLGYDSTNSSPLGCFISLSVTKSW